MATETQPTRRPRRRLPGWARAAASVVVVVVALTVVAVGVVAPLSAGLPIGWGQSSSARYHLRIGTPPFWNVAADSRLYQGMSVDCGFAVVTSPNTERAAPTTLEAVLLTRWMGVFAAAPCDQPTPTTTGAQAPWQPTGQRVTIAGRSVAIQTLVMPGDLNIPTVSDSASVSLHGSIYTFMLQEPTAAQAKQDMADFLTFVQSFRYTS